jgi:hypothetical protein
MALLRTCPLCGDICFERLLTIDGATIAMTVVAFRCVEHGHIFFLRKADIETSDSISPHSAKRMYMYNQHRAVAQGRQSTIERLRRSLQMFLPAEGTD